MRLTSSAERRQADVDDRRIGFTIRELAADVSDGSEIVRCLLSRAVSIDQREKKVLPPSARNTMPTILHTLGEHRVAFAQRVEEFMSDGDPGVFGLGTGPTGPERDLRQSIERTFRTALGQCRCGRGDACRPNCIDPDRDFWFLWHWAAGQSPRWIAKHWRGGGDCANKVSHQRVRRIIGKCRWIIWMTIKHYVPVPARPTELDRAPVTWR
jgi:hypothetical protein